MSQTLWLYQTALIADSNSPSQAREFVRAHLVEHRLGYLVDDVELVVSELATNALLHARTSFNVTLQDTGDAVLLTVQDDCPAVPSLVRAGLLDEGGRGLTIVDFVSRDWGITTGPGESKSVWASFPAVSSRTLQATAF